MFKIAEVMEVKTAFKSKQKDDEGNDLPLGSIKVRMWGQSSIIGNIRHIWARPSQFTRRIPLKGEQVMVFHGPISDITDGIVKTNGYYYINPINATDDLVLHQHPKIWWRQKGNGAVDAATPPKHYTFPDPPKKIDNIQIYEADDIIESRFGSSFRFGSTVKGNTSVYEKQQTWQGGANGDPITIIRIKKPDGASGPPKYTIEDLMQDESSMYMTVSQKLMKTQVAFKKNLDAIKIPMFSKPQILMDSDRIVLNAKNDMAIINSAKKSILCGDKVILQSSKYFVDLDALMDYIDKLTDLFFQVVSGQAPLATPSGPTAVGVNMAQVQLHHTVTFNQEFKIPK